MTNKTLRVLPGDVEAMREYALALYSRLLTEFGGFQVDDEYLDACIDELVPQDIRVAAGPTMGSAPLIASDLVPEWALGAIIDRLVAVVAHVEDGEEFIMLCVFERGDDGTI